MAIQSFQVLNQASAVAGQYGGQGAAMATGGIIQGAGGIFGGDDDDMEAPNYQKSLDCQRWLDDPALAGVFGDDYIRKASAIAETQTPTKAARTHNNINCVRQRQAYWASRGLKQVAIPGKIALTESNGTSYQAAELVSIGQPSPAPVQTQTPPNVQTFNPTPAQSNANVQAPAASYQQARAPKKGFGAWIAAAVVTVVGGVVIAMAKNKAKKKN